MRVAVVTSSYGDPWSEHDVLTRRLAGAIACVHEVDLLVAAGSPGKEMDGAVHLLRFASAGLDPPRRRAWRRALLGIDQSSASDCSCSLRHRLQDLPDFCEEEMVHSEGGHSPELYEYLRQERYDLTVFVGYHSPTTLWGVRSLPSHRRYALAAAARDPATLNLGIHDHTFEGAETILVCTEAERSAVLGRIGSASAGRLRNVGFLVGVNSIAAKTEPRDFYEHPYVVVVGDWRRSSGIKPLITLAERLENEIDPEFRLHFIGPGAERLPHGLRLSASRLDIWRWLSRAIALIDPGIHRVLGQEVLEGLLYGKPAVVNAHGGASREHAETSNGGLWYRYEEELFSTIKMLFENEDLRRALGAQGRSYAEEGFTDTDTYIKRIADVLFE